MTGHVLLPQVRSENDIIAIFRRYGRPLASSLAEIGFYDGFREGPQSQRAADEPMRGPLFGSVRAMAPLWPM